MAIRFEVRGEYIQLDQLLKAAGLVESGGAAHAAVENGLVKVDGKPEPRQASCPRRLWTATIEACNSG